MAPSVLVALLALLAGFLLAMPQSFAVEEMRDFSGSGKKASKAKSCPRAPSSARGSAVASRRAAASVKSGRATLALGVDANTATLADADLYLAAGELVEDARYADALEFLFASRSATTRKCST